MSRMLFSRKVWGVCVRINVSLGMLVEDVNPSSLFKIASRHLMPVMAYPKALQVAILLEMIS